MRFSTVSLALAAFLGLSSAVDMKYYEAKEGVPAGFEEYLHTFVGVLEDRSAGDTYISYFSEDAQLKILNPPIYDVSGKKNILALWTTGSKGLTWNHYPNKTSLAYTGTDPSSLTKVGYKTIKMDGKVETHWESWGNCSTAYITWYLNMKESTSGEIDLTPRDGNFHVFWDFSVYPYVSHGPTTIPCTG